MTTVVVLWPNNGASLTVCDAALPPIPPESAWWYAFVVSISFQCPSYTGCTTSWASTTEPSRAAKKHNIGQWGLQKCHDAHAP